MDKKLTLSLNSRVIDKAKQYAQSNGVSLSRMIENYLATLVKDESEEEVYSPLITRLIGVVEIPTDLDLKTDYTDYLIEKYR
jgi:hypothetical protein